MMLGQKILILAMMRDTSRNPRQTLGRDAAPVALSATRSLTLFPLRAEVNPRVMRDAYITSTLKAEGY